MSQYDELEEIIAHDLIFKSRLGIGEKDYNYLKKKNLLDFVGTIGTGGVAAGGVASSTVATTFFPASGFLATLGFGAAATTPIGWVIGAGVLAGGVYLGARKRLEAGRNENEKVVIPVFINTPLDLIANELLGFMLPLSLRIAISDGRIIQSEIDAIAEHYAKDWGYARAFVDRAIKETKSNIGSRSYESLSEALSEYCDKNQDCNRKAIVAFLLKHLEEVADAGGDGARKREGLEELREAFSKIR
ncbi:MAG: hypothetical protein OXC18_19055 [Desulfurellaceae bacterium]|nr:hypothetical protein [Desulfurellaceae bacterium]